MIVDTVLLAGDDATLRSLLEQELTVRTAPTAAAALASLKSRPPSLLIACDPLPDGTALDLLRAAHRILPSLGVIVVAEDPQAAEAREAMRSGAADYIGRHDPALARLPWIAARLAGVELPSRELIASIAHDMRTPLAGLHALLELMAGGADGPLTEAQRTRLQRLRASADCLTAIAEHLSDLSLLHDGRLTLSPGRVDLHDAAATAMCQVAPLARSRAVELRLALASELPPLRADAARLRQVIVLLLSAAVRHADGGVVELSAEAREQRLEMTLREIARPLPVEALPSGFEECEGESLSDRDRLHGALGISVARGLLRLHGGDLRTRPHSTDGVLAVVELPWDVGGPPRRPDHRRGPHPRPG